jgi:hypothetical protein
MRTRRELKELLGEHLDWLRASGERFDAGHVSESKRIAVAIRALVHDTSASTSLLTQLGMRNQMTWLSAVPLEATGFSGPPWVDSPQSSGFEPLSILPSHSSDFDSWWTWSLLPDFDVAVTRSWLVLQVANFDGGAHVDPTLPASYRSLSREGGLEPLRINSAGGRYKDSSNPIPSGLRTICSEVVVSIEAAAW